jgi:hypothetical protein
MWTLEFFFSAMTRCLPLFCRNAYPEVDSLHQHGVSANVQECCRPLFSNDEPEARFEGPAVEPHKRLAKSGNPSRRLGRLRVAYMRREPVSVSAFVFSTVAVPFSKPTFATL